MTLNYALVIYLRDEPCKIVWFSSETEALADSVTYAKDPKCEAVEVIKTESLHFRSFK